MTGIRSERKPLWRLPDLTAHLVYVAQVLVRTIREEKREESRYMRSHARARSAIKDVIEMPDAQVDRVIASLEANDGQLSNALARPCCGAANKVTSASLPW